MHVSSDFLYLCANMRKCLPIIIYIVLPLLLLSCRGVRESGSLGNQDHGDTIPMKYAEHLLMVRYKDYVEVTLKDPWHEGRSTKYEIRSQGVKESRSQEVRKPLRRCVVFNTAHASLLQMLGALDAVKGVADVKYMNLPEVRRRVSKSEIIDCGDSMNPDIEKIVELEADAIWLSPFENSGGYGRIEKLGIPLIECADYMETSALGRAEWMKFYGLLVGREHEADSLFAEVERRYWELKNRAHEKAAVRSVLTERLTGSVWYVPGGRSSMGKLLQDANGRYAWADDEHSGSLPLAFETILDRAGEADVWVFNYIGDEPLTYGRLVLEFHGYRQLRAFREQHVYYVNSLQVPYFEEVSFRPDWLLEDYIKILNSENPEEEHLRYLRKVRK